MTGLVVSLDSAGCRDPAACGDKAARLARARASGFPVLPGFVVPTSASREALATAVGGSAGNPYGARLAVMDWDVRVLGPVVAAARDLAAPVVVRSSSPVEGSGQWAGAFASYIGVEPDNVLTAVRGVWASAITSRVPAGSAEPAQMAVLIQPEVHPDSSGAARVEADGAVAVTAVQGSPAALMTGWSRGLSARVTPGGRIDGDRAVSEIGAAVLTAVADMVLALKAATGDSVVEWAAVDGAVVLLQCRQDGPSRAAATGVGLDVAPVPGLASIVRYPQAYAGPLGDQMVLPWWLAGEACRFASLGGEPGTELPGPGITAAQAGTAWARAQALAGEMAEQVWGGLPGTSDDLLGQLRRGSPGAAASLARLPHVDPRAAGRLLSVCGIVGSYLIRAGWLERARQLWLLTADEVTGLIEGATLPPSAAVLERRERQAVLRWEPLVFAAVMTEGQRALGEAAAPGSGAGPIRRAEAASVGDAGVRYVLVAHYPLPRFAPLLWSASGLVTREGGAGAHLIEVARSLGVPAVVGCDAVHPGLMDACELAAVDGDRGVLAFTSR